MKIDRNKLKKCTSEVPPDCKLLIEEIKSASNKSPRDLANFLKTVKIWTVGKCELYHWIDVLDIFDSILDHACTFVNKVVTPSTDTRWVRQCDSPAFDQKKLLVAVLHVTALLIEHSFSRHLYSSMEHLTSLLAASDMSIVLAVLNLLYVFAKRSNYITRLPSDKKQRLLGRLTHLAESWGGKENGFGLAQCCQDVDLSHFPPSATTLHFEFYAESAKPTKDASSSSVSVTPNKTGSSSLSSSSSKQQHHHQPPNASVLQTIHLEHVDKTASGKLPSQLMEELTSQCSVPIPREKLDLLFTHLRLAFCFATTQTRIQCVQARLQALSILVYSNSLLDNSNTILYNGLIEELVDILELKGSSSSPTSATTAVTTPCSATSLSAAMKKKKSPTTPIANGPAEDDGVLATGFYPQVLTEIKAAALRTLTSIIHLDRNPKMTLIIDATGASSYHGFLPVLVRSCIQAMLDNRMSAAGYPQTYATALFSFLYHLASYEQGGEALVACGMMESLLKVINHHSEDQDHITPDPSPLKQMQFVTRAVRVIDLITNLDMNGFQTHHGLQAFISRLDHEVHICRKEQPFVIRPAAAPAAAAAAPSGEGSSSLMDTTTDEASRGEGDPTVASANMTIDDDGEPGKEYLTAPLPGVQCLPQRAALLKSMLTFLKKAIPDPAFSDSIRHVMDGDLPRSLKHIISNAEYYGPSLFLLATDVVNGYIFQEPSLLSSLQDSGLTDVVLHALLVKDVPATREVLSSLPNVFSALCLNARGLQSFVECKPFQRLFKVLLSPEYLTAMRRRRSSDPLADTASSLGNAMDELMRHQPSVRTDAIKAIIQLLENIRTLGTDPQYVAQKSSSSSSHAGRLGGGGGAGGVAGAAEGAAVLLGGRVGEVRANNVRASGSTHHARGESSDEEDEEDEDVSTGASTANATTTAPAAAGAATAPPSSSGAATDAISGPADGVGDDGCSTMMSVAGEGEISKTSKEKTPIPLVEYVINVMKFVEAILSNNTTDDHCREFVTQGGLVPLLGILSLPNLPIDFPSSQACQSVASVAKAILTLSHEPQVLKQGLLQLQTCLTGLDPLHHDLPSPGGSHLLKEFAEATVKYPGTDVTLNPQATPLLHRLSSAHAYITTFVHTCRVGQTEMRTLSLSHWGSDLGLSLLHSLSKLYNSLVWESTILLGLCATDDSSSPSSGGGSETAPPFGKADLDLLLSALAAQSATTATTTTSTNNVSTATPTAASTAPPSGSVPNSGSVDADEQPMDVDESSRASLPPTSLPASLAPPSGMPHALLIASASPTSGGSSATDSGNEHDGGAGGMDDDDDGGTAAGLAGLIALRGDPQHDGRASNAPSNNDVSSATGTADTTPTTCGPDGSVGGGGVAKDASSLVGSGGTPTGGAASGGQVQHLRQIKPLLTVSSRLGRTLAELFGLLVKLSVGSPVRQRSRGLLPNVNNVPSDYARAVSSAIARLITHGFTWVPPPDAPTPKLRLTFYICALGFTSPMLFDDKKNPFHLMLQNFLQSGGQDAFFEIFFWTLSCGNRVPHAEGLESPELPEGAGEFLDSWLMLLEKMVNVKTMLETPHTLPAKHPGSSAASYVPFDPVMYLVSAHKSAFNAVMLLWNKKPLPVYGPRMSESILSIMCHILKGETTIRDKLKKKQEAAAGPPAVPSDTAAASGSSSSGTQGSTRAGAATAPAPAAGAPASNAGAPAAAAVAAAASSSSSSATAAGGAPAPVEPPVNPGHLQQLMDMGFGREHAQEALMHTASLEQATEWILSHPPPPTAIARPGGAAAAEMEMDMGEEEAMVRAIAMSLGESLLSPEEQAEKQRQKEEEARAKKEAAEKATAMEMAMKEEEPIATEVIDRFTDTMLEGCLRLLDTLPDTVYRMCDLMVVVTQRNGSKWRDSMLSYLVTEIDECAKSVMKELPAWGTGESATFRLPSGPGMPCTPDAQRYAYRVISDKLVDSSESSRLSTRLHLLTLLFEEMRVHSAEAIENSSLVDTLCSLLEACNPWLVVVTAGVVVSSPASPLVSPKWLGPLLLLLDLFEKVSVSSRRKAEVEKFAGPSHAWKWFDDRSGRWCTYSSSNNSTIDKAYRAGDTNIRFTAGRRRYTVHFNTMTQINEETGNRRPVMLSLPPSPDKKESAPTTGGAASGAGTPTGSDGAPDSAPPLSSATGVLVEENSMETEEEGPSTLTGGTPSPSTSQPPPSATLPAPPTSLSAPEDLSGAVAAAEQAASQIATTTTTTTKATTTSSTQSSEQDAQIIKVFKGLSSSQSLTLVRCCTTMIGVPVDPDTLHAALRLLLRLTRVYANAMTFVEIGGHQHLLNLTQVSAFCGFTSLATLLLRHVLEDPTTLRHTMEKVVRSATTGIGSNSSGVAQGSIGSRELHYVLRVLGPAACRNPDLFAEVTRNNLRIALPPYSRREEDEQRLTGPNAAQLVKCTAAPSAAKGSAPSPLPSIEGASKSVVYELLNFLAKKTKLPLDEVTDSAKKCGLGGASGKSNDVSRVQRGRLSFRYRSSSSDPRARHSADIPLDYTITHSMHGLVSEIDRQLERISSTTTDLPSSGSGGPDAESPGMEEGQTPAPANDAQRNNTGFPSGTPAPPTGGSGSGNADGKSSSKGTKEKDPKDKDGLAKEMEKLLEEKRSRPLLPKSSILRLLAELVRSYHGVAPLITGFVYQPNQSELIGPEECTVLAFVLDHCLPPCQTAGDKDTPALTRVLIAAIAAAVHSPEAQLQLVVEAKLALGRALSLPESSSKHQKIQALVSLMSTMIESCPSPPQSHSSQPPFKNPNSTSMNNVIRLMLKKGVITDLARVSYSLDLSSPHMATTVNATLKPLETLSRIVNQPQITLQSGLPFCLSRRGQRGGQNDNTNTNSSSAGGNADGRPAIAANRTEQSNATAPEAVPVDANANTNENVRTEEDENATYDPTSAVRENRESANGAIDGSSSTGAPSAASGGAAASAASHRNDDDDDDDDPQQMDTSVTLGDEDFPVMAVAEGSESMATIFEGRTRRARVGRGGQGRQQQRPRGGSVGSVGRRGDMDDADDFDDVVDGNDSEMASQNTSDQEDDAIPISMGRNNNGADARNDDGGRRPNDNPEDDSDSSGSDDDDDDDDDDEEDNGAFDEDEEEGNEEAQEEECEEEEEEEEDDDDDGSYEYDYEYDYEGGPFDFGGFTFPRQGVSNAIVDDDLFIHLEDMFGAGSGGMRTYQAVPITIHDTGGETGGGGGGGAAAGGAEATAVVTIPPAPPQPVLATHPLLVRHADSHLITGQPSSTLPQFNLGNSRFGSSGRPGGIMSTVLGGVFGGTSRAAGASGGTGSGHRGGGGGSGGAGTSYRILGSNAAQEILHLTNQLANGGISGLHGATRLLLAGNAESASDLRLLQAAAAAAASGFGGSGEVEGEIFDDLFPDDYNLDGAGMGGGAGSTATNNLGGGGGAGGASSSLTGVHSALSRWGEEARVLDGDSVHDCLTALKPTILGELERHRDSELKERKEKRRVEQEEEEKKKKEKDEQYKKEEEKKRLEKEEEEAKKGTHSQPSNQVAASGEGTSASTLHGQDDTFFSLPSGQNLAVSVSQSDDAISDTPMELTTVVTGASGNASATAAPASSSHDINSLFAAAVAAAAANSSTNTPESMAQSPAATSNDSSMTAMDLGTSRPEIQSRPEVSQTNESFLASLASATPLPASACSAASLATATIASTAASASSAPASSVAVPSTEAGGSGGQQTPSDEEPSAPSVEGDLPSTPGIVGGAISGGDLLTSLSLMTSSLASSVNSTTATPPTTSGTHTPQLPPTIATASSSSGVAQADDLSTSVSIDFLSLPLPDGVEAPPASAASNPSGADAGGAASGTEAPSSSSVSAPAPPASAIQMELNSTEDEEDDEDEDEDDDEVPGAIAGAATAPDANESSGTVTGDDSASGIPDGIDPSFLAALPENIRQEVIQEQLRLQRIQERAQQQAQAAASLGAGATEVSPEFLAALPPNIQEEVLAQQRAEQARLATIAARTSTTTSATAGVTAENATAGEGTSAGSVAVSTAPTSIMPSATEDPASFIQSLPSSLRQQVLADMDDSVIAVLPSDLANEARTLRRDLEQRHRQIMQERLFSGSFFQRGIHSGGTSGGHHRYAIRSFAPHGGRGSWGVWGNANRGAAGPSGTQQTSGGQAGASSSAVRLRGRQILDHEALTCLLVLLFVDEPKLHVSRLHRVFRNLCYHVPTRAWLVRSLLSILQRTQELQQIGQSSVANPDQQSQMIVASGGGGGEYGNPFGNNSNGGGDDKDCNKDSNKDATPSGKGGKGKSFQRKGVKSSTNNQQQSTPVNNTNALDSAAVSTGNNNNNNKKLDAHSAASLSAQSSSSSSTPVAVTPSMALPTVPSGSTWLTISLDAALGCRANVFQLHARPADAVLTVGGKGGRKVSSGLPASNHAAYVITIHPQASPVVCRHVLDTLISLAKSFPTHFLPGGKKEEDEASSLANASSLNKSASDHELPRGGSACRNSPGRAALHGGGGGGGGSGTDAGSSSSSRPSSSTAGGFADNDFWEILLRLDGSGASARGSGVGSKGKQSAAGSNSSLSGVSSASVTFSLSAGYNDSPLGTLMEMLAHPVIKRTTQLTDRLLRLLSLVCITLTEEQPASTADAAGAASTNGRNSNAVVIARSEESSSQPTPAQATATTEPQPSVLQPSTVAPSIHGGSRGATASNSMDTNIVDETTADANAHQQPQPQATEPLPMTPVTSSFSMTEALRTSTPVSARPSGTDSEETPMEPGEHGTDSIDSSVTVTPKTDSKVDTVVEREIVLESQLNLAVDVLTSKACTEEGLEDCTNLLLHISRINPATRAKILTLLLNGAQKLGMTVESQIRQLHEELRAHNQEEKERQKAAKLGASPTSESSALPDADSTRSATAAKNGQTATTTTTSSGGGVLANRFAPAESIVINAPTTVKGAGRELQLAGMQELTNKSSSQHFFLRILKVIIQLREAARLAAQRARQRLVEAAQRQQQQEAAAASAGGTGASARGQFAHDSLLSAYQSEVEAIFEMMDRSDRHNDVAAARRLAQHLRGQALSIPVSAAAPATPAVVPPSGATAPVVPTTAPTATLSVAAPSYEAPSMGGNAPVTLNGSAPDASDIPPLDASTPMEVDAPAAAGSDTTPASAATEFDEFLSGILPRLSQQLDLETLWDSLGACLKELATTSDSHAVLVLQPTVEAFFLVHASEKPKSSNNRGAAPQSGAAWGSRHAHLPASTSHTSQDPLEHVLASDLSGPPSPAPPPSSSQTSNLSRDTSSLSVSNAANTTTTAPLYANLHPDTQKFIRFAETHHTVLNQILRQSTQPIAEGPFAVLVEAPYNATTNRILDFDVKRRYFRQELERLDSENGIGRGREDLAVHVRRDHVFEDSFRELHRRTAEEWKNRFYIVFEGEEGQDAGGLLREWYLIISREIFNPMYALWSTSPGDRVTYTPNPASYCNSNHLSYFKFVGHVIAKAAYDNKLLECYFTRSFYKHILGVHVKYRDMESEDYAFYQGLVFLLENSVDALGYELTFSTEIQEFGVTEVRDLKPDGRRLPVTEENKHEYVKLVCQEKMTGAIRKQINAFLDGFYDIIPKRLISIFNEQELELLISGLPTIDIDDLKANTEYHKYQVNSLQIQWFWRALRSFDPSQRAKFLQFVTGTSKVPLQGFANLEGMNGIQRFQIHRDDRSTDRLPSAHTCFNQLDLPAYETYDKLRAMLIMAISECSEGFGLA